MSKRVLLVGIGGGIGQAAASRLIDSGYEVIGTVRDAAEQATAAAKFKDKAQTSIVDLSDAEKTKQALDRILAAQDGPLAAAIGCAGMAAFGPIETIDFADLRAIMEINTFANVALYQSALPYLRASRGKLVIVSSYAGALGTPLFGQYSASKHALEVLMDVARLEAGQWGIGVSLVVPGGVKTAMTDNLPPKLNAQLAQFEPETADLYRDYFGQYVAMLEATVKDYADPDDVAQAILTAVEADDPEPRYVVGEDAKGLIAQKHALSDRDFDAFLRTIFPGSAAAQ